MPKMTQSAEFCATESARPSVNTAEIDCIVSCSFCFDTLSARTPAGIESSKSGPNCMKIVTPTSAGRSVRSWMYAGSVKFCIHVPICDKASPTKMMRKERYDQAAFALPGSRPCSGGFGSVWSKAVRLSDCSERIGTSF